MPAKAKGLDRVSSFIKRTNILTTCHHIVTNYNLDN
jgi:hypothetical protein